MSSPQRDTRGVEHNPPSQLTAHWPERIIELGTRWAAEAGPVREQVLGETWELLNTALLRYLRVYGRRYDYGFEEDFRDIAAQKSLDLLNRIHSRNWNPRENSPGQLCRFVSTLARNGLVDHLRVVGSRRAYDSRTPEDTVAAPGLRRVEQPDERVHRTAFVEAMRECIHRLRPRARAIWFLRVMLDMPTRKIAGHPAVHMKAGTVDVTLLRCRNELRHCMEAKGFRAADIPRGTLAQLWQTFEADIAGLTGSMELDHDTPPSHR